VNTAIDEIEKLVLLAFNTLNARMVFVTADHGFVYRSNPPDEISRNKIVASMGEPVKSKKRYILGKNLVQPEFTSAGKVSHTSGVLPTADMSFVIPKGMNLFHFVGGARFFHGGMSLQEVVVPVVSIEQPRGYEKEKTRIQLVGVQVLGQDHRITTGKHRFEMIQTEAVSTRIKAVTYKIGIYRETELVSNLQIVSFDSSSQDMADRKKDVVLTLKNTELPSSAFYHLVFRDVDTDISELSIPVRIDRAFTNDF
jgi:hypothetical protein